MTNIPSSHPMIAVLRQRVEQTLGLRIASTQSIQTLVDTLHCRVNEDTIRRLWQVRQDTYRSIRHSTLDILCAYVGAKDWDDFVATQQTVAGTESELHPHRTIVVADDVAIGSHLLLTWLPDRECEAEYLGTSRWRVVRVVNSRTLAPGDEFYCRTFVVGEAAFLDSLIHDGVSLGAYKIGTQSGLTMAKILS